MYKIGYLGNFEKVPQVVEYILNSVSLYLINFYFEKEI